MKEKKIFYNHRGRSFIFLTASGVFSKDRVDKGTEVLIDSITEEIIGHSRSLLDLGCGYGVVGIIMKTIYPSLDVMMIDINERAIFLARKNAEINKVEVSIKKSHGFNSIKRSFDIILFNPPMSAGRKLCLELLKDSFKHLNQNGKLIVVARHRKGGKYLMDFMNKLFGNVHTIRRSAGYHVYLSQKQ